eukprot:TRINITY_DN2359_c0_g1_i3.p1 TRINITY_DN2359_c0_g1~~TRINITY_DN2359_c0_g1_i3.p1  ORF type:complete len:680 (+),score=236.19 TRINITY_DN2359_c0_g1_i3:112-2151(+)
MDFSTPASALQSLQRREMVPPEVRSLGLKLAAGPFANDDALPGLPDEAVAGVKALLASQVWEALAVGLLLAKHVVDCQSIAIDDDFMETLFQVADTDLEHSEPRVRGLVAAMLGSLARREGKGLAVYDRFFARLSSSIESNFERTHHTITDRVSGDKEVAVDDTTGWKALETSILALKELVAAIGRPLADGGHITDKVIDYTCRGATEHVNRHVREASFRLIAAIIEACESVEGCTAPAQGPLLTSRFVPAIAKGMQDNWSQVRFAASVANRALLGALPNAEAREAHFDLLLPRMCLNRYYMAEGVKLYSQETWRRYLDGEGRTMVAKHAPAVVAYYVAMTDANNHVVREAACHCIAEMAAKVDHAAIAPHVPALLRALLICFKDESWPVRDAACVASGRFAAAFPEECREQLPLLFERWFKHLAEPIWSVREDSAAALGEVCAVYGREAIDRCLAWVKEMLPKAREQPAQTYEQMKAMQNDAKAHTDKQRYSCGSLAPKLKKGGCSDCEVTRASVPWEYADGAIYMAKELCAVAPEEAAALLPQLADVAALTHFPQADTLRETLFKALPEMARTLGKKLFRPHLEALIGPLFDALSRPGTHQLAGHAAGACVRELSAFMGPSIFRGRLSPDQIHIMETSPYVIRGVERALPPVPHGMGAESPPIGMAPWAQAVGVRMP